MDSTWPPQATHISLFNTLRLQRFNFVGRESKHARQTQIFTFPGIQAFHNFSPPELEEEEDPDAPSPLTPINPCAT